MIKELIETTLEIPVQTDLSVALMPKCATYELTSIETGVAGDGDEEEPIYNYQVILHYKESSRSNIVADAKTLKAAIIEEFDSSIPSLSIYYDTGSHYWQANIEFQTIEEV